MSGAERSSADRLRRGVDAMSLAQRELDQTLRELRDQLQATLGQWDEPARAAYERVHHENDAALGEMTQIMVQLRDLLADMSRAGDAHPNVWHIG